MNALPANDFVMCVPPPDGNSVVQHLPVGGSSFEPMSPQSWSSGPSSGSSQDVFPQAASEATTCPIVLPNSRPAVPWEWKSPAPSLRYWEGGASGDSETAAPDGTPTFHGSAGQERHFVNSYFTVIAASSPTAGGNAYQGSPVRQGLIDVTTSGHGDANRSVRLEIPSSRPAFQQGTSRGRGCRPSYAPGTAQTTGSESIRPGPASDEGQFPGFLLPQESWTIDWSDSWGNVLQAQMEGRRCDDYIAYNKNGEAIDPFRCLPDKSSFPLRFIERPRRNEEQRCTDPWPTSFLRAIPNGITTLAIRNIPPRYTQEMLLIEFQPDGTFDLFFQPYSFRNERTMGLVFINFRTHGMALAFQQTWHRQFLRDHGRTKHLDVAAATVQGVRDNLAQLNLKNVARLQHASMLPAFFSRTGQRLDSIAELVQMGIIPFDRSLLEE